MGLVEEAPFVELWIEEEGPPVVDDLEALARAEPLEALEDPHHRERRLEAADVEAHRP
jgi:hypothetical protein